MRGRDRTSGTRPRIALILAAASAMIFAVLVPMSGIASANHGTRTLELTPEQADNGVSTTHTITATLSATPDVGSPIEIDFEISGPGDVDGGDTPLSPDRTCTITNPATTCTVNYSSAVVGTDSIRGWIDHDKDNATTEADPVEGLDEATTPGNKTEPDDTDLVAKLWFTGLPPGAVLDCVDELADGVDDDDAVNPISGTGRDEVYTCTLVDTGPTPDEPIAGMRIDVENLGGSNDPDNSAAAGTVDFDDACTTDADGECTVTISPIDSQLGTADICFWADVDVDAVFDPAGPQTDGGQCGEAVSPDDADTTDVVTKSWEARAVDSIDVTPDIDVNLHGTSHTVTATVYDQFGDPVQGVNVDIAVTGRNAAGTLDRVTDANGEVTFTYTDATNVGEGDDDITACADLNDDDACAGEPTDTAVKRWIDEAATAADVEVDMEGCDGNTGNLGHASWDAEATPNVVDSTHLVCATAVTAGGEILYGHEITFTSTGVGMIVDADGNDIGPSLAVAIDGSDYAQVELYSTESGEQTIEVSIDGKTDSGTKEWLPDDDRNIDLEPETATNDPGTIHEVTATVVDRFGNGVPGVTVTFNETGAGVFRSGASQITVVTNADGVATAETTTLVSETGDQTITATIDGTGPGNDCDLAADDPNDGDPAGNCSDDVVKTWEVTATCPGFEGDTRNQIVGTPGDDVLVGTDQADIICGKGGEDVLRGRLGNDVIKGGGGDDLMKGGGGRDSLFGGKGPDTANGNKGSDLCRSAKVQRSCER